MRRTHARILLPAMAALMASAAGAASMQVGTTFTTTAAGQVTAQFVSSTSPWGNGQLYFLSYQASGGSLVTVTSDTSANLGNYLFNNASFASGYGVILGSFDANTVLNFAYRVSPPGNGVGLTVATNFRTDTPADAAYFGLTAADPLTGAPAQMAFEDRKGPSSDLDRNDMVFNLLTAVTAIPAPGAMSLVFLGALAVAARQRRG